MSPVRNASKALADVMARSERRGAEEERIRLSDRAQSMHDARHGPPGRDFRACGRPDCLALTELLKEAPRSG